MKIFVISALYGPNAIGGAEIVARSIAEGLAARGHEIVVASLAADGIAREENVSDVHCYYVPLANLYWPHSRERSPNIAQKALWHALDAYNPFMARRLGRLFDREAPDVIHAHNLQGFSVSAWRAAELRRFPVVQTIHDYYLSCPNSVMFRDGVNCVDRCVECRIYAPPRRIFSKSLSAVTAVSKRLLERLEHFGLFRNVATKEVIRGCGVDPVRPTPRNDIPPGTPLRFGFLGRLDPIKGLESLLQAFRLMERGKATLTVGGAGDHSYVDRLRDQYGGGAVTFMGFVERERFFEQIDVLVVPSLWEEPLGLIALEALQCGIPVIASKAGGLPEIVEEGKTGWFFPPGDSAELARRMTAIVDSGLNARRFAKDGPEAANRYTLGKALSQYERVLVRAAADSDKTKSRQHK